MPPSSSPHTLSLPRPIHRPAPLHPSRSTASSSSTMIASTSRDTAAFDDAPLTAPAPAAFGTTKPFSMADIAAAAMARPRTAVPWAERDDLAECPRSPSSSCGSGSPFPSLPSSPFSDATSCAMTPSSSAGSFCLPPPAHLDQAPRPPLPSFASSGSTLTHSTSAPALSSILPPRPPPKVPLAAPTTLPRTVSAPSVPLVSTDPWNSVDFSLKLLFTSGNAPAPSSQGASSAAAAQDEPEHTLPPAFFPSQRISFSPRLRIASQAGLAFSSLGGMHLGVTGMCETLDADGAVKSKRMIADFCIDLSSGLRIWKRDADTARKAAAQRLGRVDLEDDGETRLPPGTYVLPLSMKVPNSDRLCVSLSLSLSFVTSLGPRL